MYPFRFALCAPSFHHSESSNIDCRSYPTALSCRSFHSLLSSSGPCTLSPHVFQTPGAVPGSISGFQSFRNFRSSLTLTGFVRKKFMPLEKASCRTLAEARPVKATIIAGFCPRLLCSFRIARAESIPFMTGIEMSTS